MKKIIVALVIGILVIAQVGAGHADINIGGYSFDDNAFVDALIAYSGSYISGSGALNTAQLTAVLTDKDESTWAGTFSSPAWLKLGFTDNIVINGSGADLALFELGVQATFPVTIGGTTKSYNTMDTGFDVITPENATYNLNVALVDLSDFGVASISDFVVDMDSGGTPPSLTIAGGLNSASTAVPEPTTMLLLGSGLIGLAGYGRKKFFKK